MKDKVEALMALADTYAAKAAWDGYTNNHAGSPESRDARARLESALREAVAEPSKGEAGPVPTSVAVWLAKDARGRLGYFGERYLAQTWAGSHGTVENVTLPVLAELSLAGLSLVDGAKPAQLSDEVWQQSIYAWLVAQGSAQIWKQFCHDPAEGEPYTFDLVKRSAVNLARDMVERWA